MLQELLAEKKLVAHFNDYFDTHKPKRKSSSNYNYALRLNGLVKSVGILNTDEFFDHERMIGIIQQKPATTRTNIYTTLMDWLDCDNPEKHKECIEIYRKYRDSSSKVYHQQHKKSALTKNQSDNVITYNELLSYYKEIKKLVKLNDYDNLSVKHMDEGQTNPAIDYLNLRLLLRLYILHPSRNEYATLKMISVRDYNMIEHKMYNYLVFTDRRPCFLSINDYKTYERYGQKIIPIKDKELLLWIRNHKNKFGYQEHMFYLQNGVPYTPLKMAQQLTKYSKKHINKAISSTLMYKIIINEISKKYNKALTDDDMENIHKYEKDLETFAKTRGHSLETQQSIYHNELDSHV